MMPMFVLELFKIGDVRIQKLGVVTVAVTILLVAALAMGLKWTSIGLHMRSAAEDFRMARLLGVRANRVIAVSFAISGFLAGTVSLIFLSQVGAVVPTTGISITLVAFVGTVVGGMGNLSAATAGGFLLGVMTVVFPDRVAPGTLAVPGCLRVHHRHCDPAAPPAGPSAAPQPTADPLMSVRKHDQIMAGLTPVAGPSLLVIVVVAIVAGVGDAGLNRIATLGLVNLILVVGLYTFVGNSGILSFGQMSFMAVGAYISGALTIPLTMRNVVAAQPAGAPRHRAAAHRAGDHTGSGSRGRRRLHRRDSVDAASRASLPGIASLAVLQITYVVASNWNDMTGGAASMPGVPRTTGLWSTLVWALAAIAVAYLFPDFALRTKAPGSAGGPGVPPRRSA